MKPEEGALVDSFEEAFHAIDVLYEMKLIQPALVLLYSTMDAAAWLDVEGDGDVRKQDFVRWVEAYFLPDSGLACTSLELYGALCGLLHSLTAFCKLSREGKVRTLGYARGTASVRDLNEAASILHRSDLVGVHVYDLRKALRTGMQRFLDDAATDRRRWANVTARAKNLFSHLPQIAMTEALDKLRSKDA